MIETEILSSTRTYQDEQTMELDSLYDAGTCPKAPVGRSLNKYEREALAYRLLEFSRVKGKFVGLEVQTFRAYLAEKEWCFTDPHPEIFPQNHDFVPELGDLLEKRLLRTSIQRDGNGEEVSVVFPTGALLDTQGVARL